MARPAAVAVARTERELLVNLGAVLVTGLFAGGVSCAAVQGGLLTGLVTRQRAATVPATKGNRRPVPKQAPGRPGGSGATRSASAPRAGVKVKGGARGKKTTANGASAKKAAARAGGGIATATP